MTASYCLGRKGRALATPFHDIAKEIWETTLDIISVWKVHWKVIIAKCSPVEQHETDSWIQIAQTDAKPTITLILMSVDTSPTLQLIPPHVKINASASSAFYTTPVSTPQPSIVSPEQSANPPTPGVPPSTPGTEAAGVAGADGEGDGVLIDVTDHTWGVILAHRLSNSSTLTELNPALISGYLVKRGGMLAEDPPVLMEVNILHTDQNPRLYDPLLREMLGHYRGLGTLARARGLTDRDADVRPWHVAAAEMGSRALYLLM
jgi:mediator of RNA polymerase II transcription subunit 13